MMRYELNFDEDKVNDVLVVGGASYDLKGCCELLNELNDECKFLAKQRDYWKQKYDKRTKTFTFPPNCDECDFLGNNGICGYCKFTLNCYDSKEDLINGGVLPNCPLKPLITMNEQLREINKELGDDLYNCRLNKNIIAEKLKLWQDTLTEYDIYTIKDLGKSFELDAKLSKEKDEKIKELEVKVLNLELKNEELMKNE